MSLAPVISVTTSGTPPYRVEDDGHGQSRYALEFGGDHLSVGEIQSVTITFDMGPESASFPGEHENSFFFFDIKAPIWSSDVMTILVDGVVRDTLEWFDDYWLEYWYNVDFAPQHTIEFRYERKSGGVGTVWVTGFSGPGDSSQSVETGGFFENFAPPGPFPDKAVTKPTLLWEPVDEWFDTSSDLADQPNKWTATSKPVPLTSSPDHFVGGYYDYAGVATGGYPVSVYRGTDAGLEAVATVVLPATPKGRNSNDQSAIVIVPLQGTTRFLMLVVPYPKPSSGYLVQNGNTIYAAGLDFDAATGVLTHSPWAQLYVTANESPNKRAIVHPTGAATRPDVATLAYVDVRIRAFSYNSYQDPQMVLQAVQWSGDTAQAPTAGPASHVTTSLVGTGANTIVLRRALPLSLADHLAVVQRDANVSPGEVALDVVTCPPDATTSPTVVTSQGLSDHQGKGGAQRGGVIGRLADNELGFAASYGIYDEENNLDFIERVTYAAGTFTEGPVSRILPYTGTSGLESYIDERFDCIAGLGDGSAVVTNGRWSPDYYWAHWYASNIALADPDDLEIADGGRISGYWDGKQRHVLPYEPYVLGFVVGTAMLGNGMLVGSTEQYGDVDYAAYMLWRPVQQGPVQLFGKVIGFKALPLTTDPQHAYRPDWF